MYKQFPYILDLWIGVTERNKQLISDNFVATFFDSEIDVALISVGGGYYGEHFFRKFPSLRVVASNTTSDSHIDTEYCREHGIEVITLKDDPILYDITAVAELTIGLIIALTRNVVPASKSVLNGEWSRWPFGGKKMLKNMSLGIIGHGRIGTHVTEMIRGWFNGCLWYDKPPDVVGFGVSNFPMLEIDGLVSHSDIVTVHIPPDDNEGMFNGAMFEKFKHGSYFINTSRGEIVDEIALIEALESGQLAGAATDVLSGEFREDFDADLNPLVQYARKHDNLLITPHIGGSTEDAWEMTQRRVIERVIDFFK